MEKFVNLFKQYRYGFLILLLGVGLMLLPTGDGAKQEAPSTTEISEPVSLEDRLAQILSRMEGVGKTEVMLTWEVGEQTLYETKEDSLISDTSEQFRREPVIITDSTRQEQGLIQQVISPVYRGAIIVCQGGGSPAVKLAIVEAVSDVTGLSADKITVLKMK